MKNCINTGEPYVFRQFHQKIMKNIEINRDSSKWSRNRERVAFLEPDGQHDIAERPFSHVSTVIKKSYDFYHCKYIVVRKNVCIEAKNCTTRKTSLNRPVSPIFVNLNAQFCSIFTSIHIIPNLWLYLLNRGRWSVSKSQAQHKTGWSLLH